MVTDVELTRYVTEWTDARLIADMGRAEEMPRTEHRRVMTMIKNAVCCRLNPCSGRRRWEDAEAAALGWSLQLRDMQDTKGLFSSSGNVSSPPDSAFSISDAAETLLLLRHHDRFRDLSAVLRDIIDKATPGLTSGGVHTPNHRWEIASALARVNALHPQHEVSDRIDSWVAEGIDIDGDGMYSERSANYAAHVTNPSLLVLADLTDKADLAAMVHRNLHTYADLTDAAGLVETVFSRRQDQKLLDFRTDHAGFSVGAFVTQYRRFAETCKKCALMYGWAVQVVLDTRSASVNPTDILGALLADPGRDGPLSSDLATHEGAGEPCTSADGSSAPTDALRSQTVLSEGTRLFAGTGVAVVRSRRSMATINGGSDAASSDRVGSGLACNPTFLRWRFGDAVVNSVRLSRDFFGLGPFRADSLRRTGPASFLLRESIAGSYYQPLSGHDRRGTVPLDLEFEGRFSAQMSFSARARDQVELDTEMEVVVDEGQILIRSTLDGPTTTCCFELGFKPGGSMAGAEPIGDDRWLFRSRSTDRAADTRMVEYHVGNTVLSVSSDADCHESAGTVGYQPGEAYTFLGGTDAVGGPRLYLPVVVPSKVEMRICGTQPESVNGRPND